MRRPRSGPLGSALGRAGALRVTYGTSEQNTRFLTALGELVG